MSKYLVAGLRCDGDYLDNGFNSLAHAFSSGNYGYKGQYDKGKIGRPQGYKVPGSSYVNRKWVNGKWVYEYPKPAGQNSTIKSISAKSTSSQQNKSQSAGNRVQGALNNVRNTVQNVGNNVRATAQNAWNNVSNAAQNVGNNVRNTAQNVWNGVSDFVGDRGEDVRALFGGYSQADLDNLYNQSQAARKNGDENLNRELYDDYIRLWNMHHNRENIKDTVEGAARNVGNTVSEVAQNFGNNVINTAKNAGDNVKNTAQNAGNWLGNAWNSVRNGVSDWFGDRGEDIRALRGAYTPEQIQDLQQRAANGDAEAQRDYDRVKNIATARYNVLSGAQNIGNNIRNYGIEPVADFVRNLPTNIPIAYEHMTRPIDDALQRGWRTASDWVGDRGEDIRGLFGGYGDASNGQNINDMRIALAMNPNNNELRDDLRRAEQINAFRNQVGGAARNAGGTISGAAQNAWNGASEAARNAGGAISGAAKNAWNGATNLANSAAQQAQITALKANLSMRRDVDNMRSELSNLQNQATGLITAGIGDDDPRLATLNMQMAAYVDELNKRR